MKKYVILFILLNLLTSTSFSQSKFDEKSISIVCEGSKNASINILNELAIETNYFKNSYSLETLKTVYARKLEQDKIYLMNTAKKDPAVVKHIDFLLDSNKSSYKFALCEKLKRKSASIETIGTEAYFLCRETISTEKETRPIPCF